MPIFGPVDTGRSVLTQGPSAGQEGDSIVIPGGRTASWSKGGKAQVRTMVVNVQSPFGIGGAAAYSRAATAYIVQQLVELANNPDHNPIYIQWSSGDGILTANPWDGWYRLDDVTPLEWSWERHVPCHVTATVVAPGGLRRLALAHSGGPLTSNFSGVPLNTVHFPVGSTALELFSNRATAEGNVPGVSSPVAPEPVVLPPSIANIFKGGVHIYDTINTSSNPVPTSGGTFVHANWVEVFGIDHNFVGDCVITNGLLLLVLVLNGSQTQMYGWDTTVATPTWIGLPNLSAAQGNGTRALSLIHVGAEASVIDETWSDGTLLYQLTYRLERGRYEVRLDFTPLNAASTVPYRLLAQNFINPKIAWNSTKLTDPAIDGVNPQFATDFGYGAALYPNQHHIIGWLLQNKVTGDQPYVNTPGGYTGPGDASSQAAGSRRSYAFFAVPYGVNTFYTAANLQAEAESGTLGTGWSSVADGPQSAGNVAKCVAGTASGNALTCGGVSFVPMVGFYDLWVRLKVTSAVGATPEMKFGTYINGTTFALSTTLAPNQVTTSYLWYKVVSNWGTNSFTNTVRYRAETAGVLATDWFIDEFAFVPRTLSGGANLPQFGPEDIWRQWMYDRGVKMVRL